MDPVDTPPVASASGETAAPAGRRGGGEGCSGGGRTGYRSRNGSKGGALALRASLFFCSLTLDLLENGSAFAAAVFKYGHPALP
jgi:hypothetical protein